MSRKGTNPPPPSVKKPAPPSPPPSTSTPHPIVFTDKHGQSITLDGNMRISDLVKGRIIGLNVQLRVVLADEPMADGQFRHDPMSRLSPTLRSAENNTLMFWCLGCDMPHHVAHGPGSGPRWTWNGDAIKPTFSPSILVRWEQGEPPATDPEIAAKIRSGEIVQRRVNKVCHTFVTDGRIQYLNDCTHALAGQTIDLPLWPSADEPADES